MVSWPIMDTVSGGSKRKFMPSTVEKIMKQDYKRCEKNQVCNIQIICFMPIVLQLSYKRCEEQKDFVLSYSCTATEHFMLRRKHFSTKQITVEPRTSKIRAPPSTGQLICPILC